MSRYEDTPDTAEAELRKVNDAIARLDDEIAELEGQSNQIEQEDFSTPEEEQDISRRMTEIDDKISALRSDRASAEEELSNVQGYWSN